VGGARTGRSHEPPAYRTHSMTKDEGTGTGQFCSPPSGKPLDRSAGPRSARVLNSLRGAASPASEARTRLGQLQHHSFFFRAHSFLSETDAKWPLFI